LEIYMEHANY